MKKAAFESLTEETKLYEIIDKMYPEWTPIPVAIHDGGVAALRLEIRRRLIDEEG